LLDAGVAAVYGPGTNIPVAAAEVLKLIAEKQSRTGAAPTAAS
jgi:methylmalonyl-CoA mutase cobalamin-binding subunit